MAAYARACGMAANVCMLYVAPAGQKRGTKRLGVARQEGGSYLLGVDNPRRCFWGWPPVTGEWGWCSSKQMADVMSTATGTVLRCEDGCR